MNWLSSVGVCTDGVASMTKRLSGLTIRIKEVAPGCEFTHCVIHIEMLVSRKISPELHKVLNDVIKMINHVKTNSIITCLFESLCEEIDAEHNALSYTQK